MDPVYFSWELTFIFNHCNQACMVLTSALKVLYVLLVKSVEFGRKENGRFLRYNDGFLLLSFTAENRKKKLCFFFVLFLISYRLNLVELKSVCCNLVRDKKKYIGESESIKTRFTWQKYAQFKKINRIWKDTHTHTRTRAYNI